MIFVSILLICNIGLMAVFYLITKKRFSQHNYLDNMQTEVAKLVGEIQLQTETCIRLLEDKIAEAHELIKTADTRLELINSELNKKKTEVVVLDRLMSENADNVKKANEEKKQKKDSIKIYTDSVRNAKNLKKFSSDQVLEMHREGLSASEISKHLAMPLGEVELIISLGGEK